MLRPFSIHILGWLFLTLGITVGRVLADGNPIVSTYETKGLGRDTMVWCATHSADGTMYFGGDRLYISDGDSWQSYAMGSTYAVRSLEFGDDGKLWASGYDELGWFEKKSDATWEYHSLRGKVPASVSKLGDVWNVYPTNTGAIFVAESTVLHWNGSSFQASQYDVQRRLVSTRYNSRVYISNRTIGLHELTSNGSHSILTPHEMGAHAIFAIDEIDGAQVYFTSGGIGYLEEGSIAYKDLALSKYIRENVLTSVTRLPEGGYAMGTINGGIIILNRNLTINRVLDSKHGISDNVYGLHATAGHSLWVMTSSRIHHLTEIDSALVYNNESGLPKTGALDIAFTQDTMYALTPDGVYAFNRSLNRFDHFATLKGFYRDIDLVEDELVVTTTYGVFHLTPTQSTQILNADQEAFKFRAVTPKVAILSADQKISLLDLKSRQLANITAELPDVAENFVQDAQGRLWISTASKSLLVATPSPNGPVEAESASLNYGFPTSEGFTQVAKLGDAIIGINEDHAYWLNPNTDRFEQIAGYPGGNTLAISDEDSSGRVWVALEGQRAHMPMRLGHLERTNDGIAWVPHTVAGLTKVGTPRALQIQQTAEGDVLWIAGSGGLLQIKRPGEFPAIKPRQPILTAVVRSSTDAAPQGIEERLPYSTRRIHLQFGSGEFALRDTLRYQTMLEGVDETWSAPTNTAELELANLREGKYTFKVRLLSDTGLASEPTELRFAIAPPWWRTPYAYGGYVLGFGLFATGLYQLRVRTMRRRAAILENTVRERTAELEKANAAKTEFVASMSHEIRNPMNGIIGSAHALADTPLNEQQREIVSTLRNCATFLSSLVEDVLDFSSIEAGVFNVQQQPYNPAGVLEAVSTMLAGHATEAGAHFDIEVDTSLPARLLGDPARIQQIVVNYATNALKFSGGGRVRLSTYAENGQVVFAVSDNGPGISPDEQTVLFTRFSRLKAARNAGITGTGLGLSVCRAVAERMNGSVGVSSQPGRGATFFLRLPLVPATAAISPETIKILPKFEGARALIVEDLPYNAQILGAMLAKYGFSIDVASNGRDALRLLAEHSYDTVFLDYDLPDITGLEVARRMQQIERNPKPLVVATTAYSTVQDREDCLKAGMDIFLSKPITPEKLRDALGQVTTPARRINIQPVVAPPSLNLQMLTYLAGNDTKQLWHEITRYLDSVADTREEVITALRTLNRPALGRAAHRMLSHARMVECEELTAISRDLETEASYAMDERLDELVAGMSAAIERLKKTMAHHRPEQTPA